MRLCPVFPDPVTYFIALVTVLCYIAQVPVAKAVMTPHLIGGKTLHCLLEFLCSLRCEIRLWGHTGKVTTMLYMLSKSSQWRSKRETRQVKLYLHIYKRSYIPY